jgi:nucleoside-diphosphate-sugar epimerase
MNKNVLLFGCGYLGFPLAKELKTQGYFVQVATHSPEKLKGFEEDGLNPFLVSLDFDNFSTDSIKEKCKTVDRAILMLPPSNFKNYAATIQSIADCFQKNTYVIFVSSISVYEDSSEIVNENSPCKKNHTLIFAEQNLRSNKSINTTIVRVAGLLGNGRHPVVSFLNKKKIANGLAPVNLVHQQDVVSVITKILNENIQNELFNICYPEHPTRKDFYESAADKLFSKKIKFHSKGSGKIVDGQKIVEFCRFTYENTIY